jgi:hypothetical protein
MRSISKTLWIFAAVAVLCAATSAADARARHTAHHHFAPVARVPAYDAYGPAYGAMYGARGARAEEFYGTSVPYDPDGPGWNDFQLQGTN